MKKSLLVIPFIVLVLLVLTILYKTYSVTIKLTNDFIKVNIYDNINLRDYLVSATGKYGSDFTNDVTISVEYNKEDKLNGENLYIKGVGNKIVSYSVKKYGRTFTKTLEIRVIIDPNDPDFKPNYDEIDKQEEFNNDDEPSL